MAHNRLILLMSTIPESVVALNDKFNLGIFNKDRTKRQIDGYIVDENEEYILPKRLCHIDSYLHYLCRGEADPSATVQTIQNSSYELKVSKYEVMKLDTDSEWYVKPEVLI